MRLRYPRLYGDNWISSFPGEQSETYMDDLVNRKKWL